jgi:hypothetical protein
MKRNANLVAPWHSRGLLAFAIVFLLTGCGRFRSRDAETRTPHSVTLSWTSSTSPVVGYNVYRASPAGRPVVKLSARPVAANQFIDTTVEAGHTYFYFVTSVDSKGAESGPSARVFATVPTPVTFIGSLRNRLPSFPSFESLRHRFRSLPFVESLGNRLRSLRRRIHRPHIG